MSFLSHLPLLHLPTWSLDGKPEILMNAMYACGAMFVKTPLAQQFVSSTLESARKELRKALENASQGSDDQLYLIVAGLLMQSVWFMRHRFDERAASNDYHGMLIMVRY